MTNFSQLQLQENEIRKPVSMQDIHAVAKIISEKFDPDKIILFGSHAYGQPRPWSDVDLLVVMETTLTPRQQRLEISRALSPRPFGIDIIVRTPNDLERRLELGDFFLREVVSKGKPIYECTYPRMDRKS